MNIAKLSQQVAAARPLGTNGSTIGEVLTAAGLWPDDMISEILSTALVAGGAPTLWCLHILGPDDVHPAPSKEHAEVAAERFNQFILGRKDQHQHDPVCSAVVAPWPHSAASHAESVGKFMVEWLLPKEHRDASQFKVQKAVKDLIVMALTHSHASASHYPEAVRRHADALAAAATLGEAPDEYRLSDEQVVEVARGLNKAGRGPLELDVARSFYQDLAAALHASTPKETVLVPIAWPNGCDTTVPEALRYLAKYPRPIGGEDRFNSLHLEQLAGEIERAATKSASLDLTTTMSAALIEAYKSIASVSSSALLAGEKHGKGDKDTCHQLACMALNAVSGAYYDLTGKHASNVAFGDQAQAEAAGA